MGEKIKNYKVYIIGHIRSYESKRCKKRFLHAKIALEKVGFVNIVNPLEVKSNMTLVEKKRFNLMELINSNAVYILADIPMKNSNLELQIAKQLNLIILHAPA